MQKIVKYLILLQLFLLIASSCNKSGKVDDGQQVADTTSGDLEIIYLKVKEWTPSFISYEFAIKNIGGHPIDLKDLTVQGWISKDSIYDGSDYGACGYKMSSGCLSSKQILNGNWYCGDKDPKYSDFTLKPSTYPYLILQIYGANELNLKNNTKYVKIE